MRKQLELIVGKSDRTYGKHVLLNKVLGREAGVLPILANERRRGKGYSSARHSLTFAKDRFIG